MGGGGMRYTMHIHQNHLVEPINIINQQNNTMKISLFLVLAGVSFALCDCQQQNEPVAPIAPAPIKVVVEKNEITPVTNSGGLAPASVAGKTIVFNYSSAKEKIQEGDDSPQTINGVCNMVPAIPSLTFGSGNRYYEKFSKSQDDYGYHKEAKYTKVSNTTAKIHFSSDVNEFDYVLTFTSPTSGVATRTWSQGDYNAKATGITFTIN